MAASPESQLQSEVEGPARGMTVIAATCWACGRTLTRQVAKRNRRQRHFTWTCQLCEVAWSGPGEEV